MTTLADLVNGYVPMQGSTSLADISARNAPYVKPGGGDYNTQLQPLNEMAFRQWIQQNRVPFNPDAQQSDYDMRGFYQGLQQQNPRATSAVNPNDGRMHYPDRWKTPLHETFSADSQWAGPVAPRWNEQDQLIAPSGRIIFDERKR
jgi:hypothetical protein